MYRAALFACTLATVASAGAATFQVTNLNDAGAGSLRQAVIDANAAAGPDTITFTVTGTITLTTGSISVTDAVTIQGPGSAQLIIDGNANSRIFSIVETSPAACPALTSPVDLPVAVSGMTLRNGQRNVVNSVGGAIYSNKSLAVDDVAFYNNRARGGGAIWFSTQYAGQTLTIHNSRFSGNQAKEIVGPTTAGGHAGGAIGVAENCTGSRTQPVTVSITDSDFFGNVAQAGPSFNARGGAIYFCCDADVTIDRTTVEANSALQAVGDASINGQGGGISGSAKTVAIRNSTIAANVAQRSSALHLFNDALARQSVAERMVVEIVNATISNNRAFETSTVFAYANTDLRLRNATVVQNRSDQNRTSGVNLVTGATVPASASNALAPTLTLESSVVFNPDGVRDIGKDVTTMSGALAVPSNNSIIGRLCDSSCGAGALTLSGTGNQVGIDPLLGPLADNGGPTLTRLPQLGSPAIGTGNNALALQNDQRGASFPRTIGALTDAGATEYAYPAQCVGFGDVTGNNAFCASVSWIKNRGVTQGCGDGSIYCPNDAVIRLHMAAFMKRLGEPLSGVAFEKSEAPGLLDFTAEPVVCQTAAIPASLAPRRAVLDAVFAGIAGADSLARGNLVVSEDGGATWQDFQLYTIRTTFRANQWRNLRVTGTRNVEANKAVRFGLKVNRPGTGASGVQDSTCRLRVRMDNSSGFTPV